MRRFVALFVLVILLCVVPVSYAHPGRTDSKGGHIDHSTGEYHYHHGYPAHSHDNGCPYEHKDKTGSSSGSTGPKSITPIAQAKVNTVKTLRTVLEDSEMDRLPLYLVICCFVLIIIYCVHANGKAKVDVERRSSRGIIAQKEQEHQQALKAMREKAENALCIEREKARNEIMSMQADCNVKLQLARIHHAREIEKKCDAELKMSKLLRDKYGDQYLLCACGAPDGAYISQDGLPHCLSNGQDLYEFYLSASMKYHTKECRYAANCIPINAKTIKENPMMYSGCLTCVPKLPDTQWVRTYCYLVENIETDMR